jgi:hypothetical protein
MKRSETSSRCALHMTADAPLEDYWEACDSFLQTQNIEDVQERVERMREVQARWASCFSRLMNIAETADTEVWRAIGDAFANGRGTGRSREEAMRWFERGAEAGHTLSMIRLCCGFSATN